MLTCVVYRSRRVITGPRWDALTEPRFTVDESIDAMEGRLDIDYVDPGTVDQYRHIFYTNHHHTKTQMHIHTYRTIHAYQTKPNIHTHTYTNISTPCQYSSLRKLQEGNAADRARQGLEPGQAAEQTRRPSL